MTSRPYCTWIPATFFFFFFWGQSFYLHIADSQDNHDSSWTNTFAENITLPLPPRFQEGKLIRIQKTCVLWEQNSQARWACPGIQIYQVLLGNVARIKEGARISPNSEKIRQFHGVIACLQSLTKRSRQRKPSETRSKISHFFSLQSRLDNVYSQMQFDSFCTLIV